VGAADPIAELLERESSLHHGISQQHDAVLALGIAGQDRLWVWLLIHGGRSPHEPST
jgi:hypothetical protein